MKRLKIMIIAVTMAALIAAALPSVSFAEEPYLTCATLPNPLSLVAKFEWDESGVYKFDKADGQEGLVEILEGATDQFAEWISLVEIQAVIIKDGSTPEGGDNIHTYYPPEGFYTPTSGYISWADFPDDYKDISNVQFCGTETAVNLISFDAQADAGAVTVNWETGTEVDNAGFNLFRAASANGPWSKVNDTLIVAQGDPVSGASYSFVDTPGYGTFYYQLEDVDFYGMSTLHGPVKATVASPFRRPLHRPTLPGY